MLVYFSNISENTHRFVQRLGIEAVRIPVHATDPMPEMTEPYILITPTYGSGVTTKAIPKQVIKFINANHNLIRGVVASGNTNFGRDYAIAGETIAKKCNVPFIDKFEILGMPEDVARIKTAIENFDLSK